MNRYIKSIKKQLHRFYIHLSLHRYAYISLPIFTVIVFRDFFRGKTISAVPSQGGAIWPWHAEHALPNTRLIVATDQADTYYPWDVSVRNSLRNFQIPFWNHNSFGGTPLWTNGQPSPLYPPRIITSFLMGPALQHDALILFHILLGGFGLYFLCRKLKFESYSSIAAALFWMFSPMTFAWMQFEFFLPITAFTPWIFLSSVSLIQRISENSEMNLVQQVKKNFPLITSIAVLQTLLLLGSNIQFVMFVWVPVGLYLSISIFILKLKGNLKLSPTISIFSKRLKSLTFKQVFYSALNSAVFVGIISFLTLLLSATAWLPIAIFASGTSRAPSTYSQFVGPTNVIPVEVFIKNTFWHLPYPYVSTHLFQMAFFGTLATLFALIGFLNISKNQRIHQIGFARILAIALFLITIGTPAAWFVYKFVPGMQYLTALGRMLFLWTFAFCVLSALGIETIIKGLKWAIAKLDVKYAKILSAPVLVIVCLLVIGNVYQTSRYGLSINPPETDRKSEYLFPETAAIKALKKNMGPDDRIIPITRGDQEWSIPTMYASHHMVYNINSAAGYESIVSADSIDTWRMISGESIESLKASNSPGSYISVYRIGSANLDALAQVGVTLIFAPPDIEQDSRWNSSLQESGLNPKLIYAGSDARIYRVSKNATTLFKNVVCSSNDIDSIEDIYVEDTAISIETDKPIRSCSSSVKPAHEAQSIRLPSKNPNSIAIDTKANLSGILFIPVTNDPGWKATIDGKQVKILVANHSFMAVEVPKGSHKVRLNFVPPGFNVALVLTVAGIAIIAIGLFISRKKETDLNS